MSSWRDFSSLLALRGDGLELRGGCPWERLRRAERTEAERRRVGQAGDAGGERRHSTPSGCRLFRKGNGLRQVVPFRDASPYG